jgi:hypothetical protein
MKILKAIKDFICYGSIYFTSIATVMLLLAADKTDKAPETSRFLLFLMLSFIFALGSTVYRIDGISRPIGVCLHAAIYNLGFLLFMILCDMGFSKSIIATLIFAIIYTAITVIIRLSSRAMKKSGSAKAPVSQKSPKKQTNDKKEATEYKNLFS